MKRLSILMKPEWQEDSVAYIDVELTASHDLFDAEKPHVMYWKEGWGCVRFSKWDDFSIEDENGLLSYSIREEVTPYGIHYEYLNLDRVPCGEVRWSYRLYPRILPEVYQSSPYFDFRSEPFGASGSGAFMLIMPENADDVNCSIQWELGNMPEGARGVWSLGCGNVHAATDLNTLRFSYYAVGMMGAEEDGEFGIYWFGTPLFDVQSVTGRLKDLFAYMRNFFHDSDPTYRIFVRLDPFKKSGGGTALRRSFMSGYSKESIPSLDDWFCTLAHEMVHNWPNMEEIETGDSTWFNEGTAEYYSTFLPYRAGLVSKEETVRQIGRKTEERYYDSVYREMIVPEIIQKQWQIRSIQTILYGRGFMYLANTEAALNRAGKGSIDEIVVAYAGKMMPQAAWRSFIEERLGKAGIESYESMLRGELVVPDPDVFDGLAQAYPEEIETEGKTFTTYRFRLKK